MYAKKLSRSDDCPVNIVWRKLYAVRIHFLTSLELGC